MNPLEALIQQLTIGAGPRGSTFAGRVIPPGNQPDVVKVLSQLPQDVPDMDWGAALPAMLAGLKVYHGSPNAFTKFDPKLVGTRTDPGFAGRGAYTTTSEEVAGRWGPRIMETELPEGKKWLQISGISDLYNKHGLKQLTEAEKSLPQKQLAKAYERKISEFTERMKAKGYEGIEWPQSSGSIQHILFYPETYQFNIKK